jgi:hypothetical protein
VSNARSTLTHDGKWENDDQKLFSGKREEEDGQVRQNSNRDGGLRDTDAATRAVESIPANRIRRG